ncbi:prepilin-type N-terminal cleavage/methylation domain-containing protein [Sessilibacter sp. MAH1]
MVTKLRGFTLIELLLVLILVSLLAGLATPVVTSSIVRAKESALSENLQVIRVAIDEYYADKGIYPESEIDLVDERYLRFIPNDPMTNTNDWDWIENDDSDSYGIIDVKSSSQKISNSGLTYNEW